MKIKTLTIVGVGLIGGSIGLAAKRRGVAERIVGVGRRPDTLERALAAGAIDEGSPELGRSVRGAEMVVVCTPVNRIARDVLEAGPHCAAGTVITDAGSTKAGIVRMVEGNLPDGVEFVGGHPLAGSEKRGPEFADADLFQDRLTVVTRTARTDAAALQKTAEFWTALGSRVRVMDPEEHDRALAMTSHLPHLAAAALAALLPAELRPLAASGFRDVTRTAAGDPALWSAILAENRANVLYWLQQLEHGLDCFRAALEAGDESALEGLLAEAKRGRDALGN
jgi:prephenate dehydrogenase